MVRFHTGAPLKENVVEKKDYVYNALVKKVVDGDTIDVLIDMGFFIYHEQRLRLNGINTMETNDPDPVRRESAMKAKQYVMNKILDKIVVIQTYRTDKYGRFLADVYVDGSSINQQLLNENLAVPYTGGKRT